MSRLWLGSWRQLDSLGALEIGLSRRKLTQSPLFIPRIIQPLRAITLLKLIFARCIADYGLHLEGIQSSYMILAYLFNTSMILNIADSSLKLLLLGLYRPIGVHFLRLSHYALDQMQLSRVVLKIGNGPAEN